MKTLSTCMIIKNEEDKLERCLESAKAFSDEIILVDTGSEDSSLEIAEKYTDKIYKMQWQNDFAKARNESYRYASMEYILWLDADNYIDAQNQKKIIQLKSQLTEEKSVFLLLYSDELMRPRWDHRITRRNPALQWKNPVHEQYPVCEPIRMEPIVIWHKYRGKVHEQYPQLLKKIPQEEIFSQFWLCAQCYHDYLRCGYTEEAEVYLKKLLETSWEFQEYVSPAEDFANILYYYSYYEEAMIFYQMLKESEELKKQSPLEYLRVLKHLSECKKALEQRGKEQG